MALLERRVRFGEACGPLMHYATYFDLLLCAFEELGRDFEESPEDVVAGGRVPYAPVSTTARIERYPRYGDSIRVDGAPVAVTERSFTTGYTFDGKGGELGRGWITHMTIGTDGRAETLDPEFRERLVERRRDGPTPPDATAAEPPADAAATEPPPDATAFEWTTTFRSPHVEAAGVGYFAEYARALAVALEEHLDARGASLGAISGDRYPFYPVEWTLDFRRPIRFEDTVTVRGRVAETTPEAVTIRYGFVGGTEDDRRIAGHVRYGCFDAEGERTAFEKRALAAVR